jgi:hypothetical protein
MQTPTPWINMSNDKNTRTDTDAYSEMPDLVVGDHIELVYEDSPQTVMHATVSRIFTDHDEGMGPEVEDYVACWFEINMTGLEGEGTTQISLQADAWASAMTLGTDFKYSLNGRHVTVRKL